MNLLDKIRVRFCTPQVRALIYKKYGVDIGNDCEFYPGVDLGSEPYLVHIGNHVRITADVKFITHDGGVWVARELMRDSSIDSIGEIVIGNNVMIGMQTLIMPDVHIGDNVIIAAGSIVTHDVPSNSVFAGVPAKKIKTIEDYIQKNQYKWLNTKNLTPEQKRKVIEEMLMNRNK